MVVVNGAVSARQPQRAARPRHAPAARPAPRAAVRASAESVALAVVVVAAVLGFGGGHGARAQGGNLVSTGGCEAPRAPGAWTRVAGNKWACCAQPDSCGEPRTGTALLFPGDDR